MLRKFQKSCRRVPSFWQVRGDRGHAAVGPAWMPRVPWRLGCPRRF